MKKLEQISCSNAFTNDHDVMSHVTLALTILQFNMIYYIWCIAWRDTFTCGTHENASNSNRQYKPYCRSVGSTRADSESRFCFGFRWTV